MTISEFDEKYISKGGFKSLDNFKEELMTLPFIAKHFGVDKETVRAWFIDLYGITYDPRQQRKERIINSMLKFAETHTIVEFKETYYYAAPHYYNEAVAETFSRGIYKEEKDEVQLP